MKPIVTREILEKNGFDYHKQVIHDFNYHWIDEFYYLYGGNWKKEHYKGEGWAVKITYRDGKLAFVEVITKDSFKFIKHNPVCYIQDINNALKFYGINFEIKQ